MTRSLVPVIDEYLPEGFKSDSSTPHGVEKTESQVMLLPKEISILLLGLLVCLACHVSKTFAEDQTPTNIKIDSRDQTVQEINMGKSTKNEPRKQKLLVLHTLKVKRPWNLLFNLYLMEVLEEGGW